MPLAHRGGALLSENIGIENTMEAFQNAVKLGFEYIESDVQASRDGEIFCFHDDDLARLIGRTGRFIDFHSTEIKEALVGGKATIPTLDEVFETFTDIKFNIDLKHPATIEGTIERIRKHNATDRVVLASFSHATLTRARQLAPEISTSFSVREAALLKFGLAKRATAGGGIAAQVPLRRNGIPVVTKRFVRRAQKHGVQVHVWTIDNYHEMHKLLDLGVDGLVSDQIDVLKSVLIEREQWRQE